MHSVSLAKAAHFGSAGETAWIEEIEARANAAKPGPWKRAEYEHGFEVQTGPDYGVCSVFKNTHGGFGQQIDNLEFIAHARTDIPRLTTALRAAQARIEAMEKALVPFARVAKHLDDSNGRIFGRADYSGGDWREITTDDLRRARSALGAQT